MKTTKKSSTKNEPEANSKKVVVRLKQETEKEEIDELNDSQPMSDSSAAESSDAEPADMSDKQELKEEVKLLRDALQKNDCAPADGGAPKGRKPKGKWDQNAQQWWWPPSRKPDWAFNRWTQNHWYGYPATPQGKGVKGKGKGKGKG